MHIDLPGLLVGLIVGGYWARVLRMVLKLRRKTGRAANLLPPEPLGRALRIIWYPLVALWIILPFATAFMPKPPTPLRRLYHQPAIRWTAVAVAAAALAGSFVCWKRMGRNWRMGIDPAERNVLIVTGPYAYVRHPIYALSAVLMLATVAAVPSPMMLLVGVTHLGFLLWEARREEMHLLEVHGSGYDSYRKHVGGFIPRSLTPYVADTDRTARR